MKDDSVEIRIDGYRDDGGHLRLNGLIDAMIAVRDTLEQIDRSISGKGKISNFYKVVALSHESPTMATIKPEPIEEEYDNTKQVLREFIGGWKMLEGGEITEGFNRDTIDKYIAIATVAKHEVDSIHIGVGDITIRVTDKTADKIVSIVPKDIIMLGQLYGYLEYINIHKAFQFRIYPVLGASLIKCTFNAQLLDIVKDAIGKKVLINGKLIYRAGDNYPSRAEVYDIKIVDTKKHTKGFIEFLGIAPNLTKGDNIWAEGNGDEGW